MPKMPKCPKAIRVTPNYITAGVVFLATLLVMIALSADDLASSSINYQDKYCGWLKFKWDRDWTSSITKKYKAYCDDGWRDNKDDYCDAEDLGEAWLAFGLLAFFIGIASLVTLLLPPVVRFGHFAYDVVASFCCFLAIMIWYASDEGCYNSGDDVWGDDLEMGASGVLMIFAMLLFLIAVGLRILLPKVMIEKTAVRQPFLVVQSASGTESGAYTAAASGPPPAPHSSADSSSAVASGTGSKPHRSQGIGMDAPYYTAPKV